MKARITLFVIIASAATYAQQERPTTPSHAFSSDLVAWSFMQAPQQPEKPGQQPTPEPQPETKPPQNPTPAQPEHPQSPQPPSSASQNPAADTFIGTISKEEDSFVLKVSQTTSYKLDNPQQVQQYVGQRVRVTGTLDSDINLIHVDRIEPMS